MPFPAVKIHHLLLCLLICSMMTICYSCIQLLNGWKQMSIEERTEKADIILQGLTTSTYKTGEEGESGTYSAEFWIRDVYKGADLLAKILASEGGFGGVYNLRDKKVNVTGFGDGSECFSSVFAQQYYMVFVRRKDETGSVTPYEDLVGVSDEWTPEKEKQVWKGLGWEEWSDWSTCSASCGEGSQERERFCLQEAGCDGYNLERRRCNMFSCQGSRDALNVTDKRYFRPSWKSWQKDRMRKAAWKIRTNDYLWMTSEDLFGGRFPKEFSILMTIRPEKNKEGTIFVLRSRRLKEGYHMSLEISENLKLVHSDLNGTKTVEIPAKINDGHWHQLAISIRDDSSVRVYMDCVWMTTHILRRNSMETPEDANLIIGYLYQGEMEQLTITPNPSAVAEHCSTTRVPYIESSLNIPERPSGTAPFDVLTSLRGEDIENFGKLGSFRSEDIVKDSKILNDISLSGYVDGLDEIYDKDVYYYDYYEENKEKEDNVEGSGGYPSPEDPYNGSGDQEEGSADAEVEWSDWSTCSTTCGLGFQTRSSRCVDNENVEECIEARKEKTQKRSCNPGPCHPKLTEKPTISPEIRPTIMPKMSTTTAQDTEVNFTISIPDANTPDEEIILERYLPKSTLSPDHEPKGKEVGGEEEHDTDILVTIPETITKTKKHPLEPTKSPGPETPYKPPRQPDRNNFTISKLEVPTTKTTPRPVKRPIVPRRKKPKHKHPHSSVNKPKKPYERYPDHRSNYIPTVPDYWTRKKYKYSTDLSTVPPTVAEVDSFVCKCLNGGVCHRKKKRCHCPTGYYGRYCDRISCRPGCLNDGKCSKPNVCTCQKGYTGPQCQFAVCELRCANGGMCVRPGVCSCPYGYLLPNCRKPLCSSPCYNGGTCVAFGQCRCPPGYRGRYCQQPVCEKGCKNNGRCIGQNICTCTSGWSGTDCSQPKCYPACRNGGQCIRPYYCSCKAGTSGAYCERFTCSPQCENGGRCVGLNECSCLQNYTGATCSQPVCQPPCENGGTCAAYNKCQCQAGFFGAKCQKKKCTYKRVQEPYKRGYKKLVTKKYQTKCGAWGWKTCTKTKSEYQVVYKPFMRTVYKCVEDN